MNLDEDLRLSQKLQEQELFREIFKILLPVVRDCRVSFQEILLNVLMMNSKKGPDIAI